MLIKVFPYEETFCATLISQLVWDAQKHYLHDIFVHLCNQYIHLLGIKGSFGGTGEVQGLDPDVAVEGIGDKCMAF
jgi:hypothetical protein